MQYLVYSHFNFLKCDQWNINLTRVVALLTSNYIA